MQIPFFGLSTATQCSVNVLGCCTFHVITIQSSFTRLQEQSFGNHRAFAVLKTRLEASLHLYPIFFSLWRREETTIASSIIRGRSDPLHVQLECVLLYAVSLSMSSGPTKRFTVLKTQNPRIDVSDRHRIHRSTNSEYLKL